MPNTTPARETPAQRLKRIKTEGPAKNRPAATPTDARTATKETPMTAKPARTRKPAAAKPDATPAPAKETPVTETPAPAAKPAPAAPANCACGCNQPTITAKALFVSGHDARLAGVLGRALAGSPVVGPLDEAQQAAADRLAVLSPALQTKALGIKATADRKAAEKAARAEAKAVAKAAYAAAMQAALTATA